MGGFRFLLAVFLLWGGKTMIAREKKEWDQLPLTFYVLSGGGR